MAIYYLDRKTGLLQKETVMGDGALRFAYETALGRTLWSILFGSGFCSALLGLYYDSSLSKRAIKSLISIPGCIPEEAEKTADQYRSFNDFFIRKLKNGARPAAEEPEILVSPADGRLLVYPQCMPDDAVPVKGAKKTLRELCGGNLEEAGYSVVIIRLAPVDYHRYHYPCSCMQAESPVRIKGKYHSVNPAAVRQCPDVFVENARMISVLDSPLFGVFRMIEVGAFGVGTIVQTASAGPHRKMDEKGYFKFGGSTVILIFRQNLVSFDTNLLNASMQGVETLVRCGMSIGHAVGTEL